MDTHNIHGTDVSFHDRAKEAKDFLRQDKHMAQGYLKEAERHGKSHFEVDGKTIYNGAR